MTGRAPEDREDLPVAVIGAGIVGVATAVWLQREGLPVVLLDRAGPGEGASYGNAGVLATVSIVPVTVPGLIGKAPRMLLDADGPLFLRWSYLPRLLPFLARYLGHCRPEAARRIARALEPILADSLEQHCALAEGTGAERWIVPCDYLFGYADRRAFAADAFAWDLRRTAGFTWEELEGPAVRAYDPLLSPAIAFAVRCGGHGRISDPGRYVQDLAAHVVRRGGRLLRAEVRGFLRERGRLSALLTDRGPVFCRAAVVATGAWSGPLVAGLGLKLPLESERGYHLELLEPSALPRAPTMIAAGKFVATPMEGRLRLAGLVEFGGLKAPPNPRAHDLLLRGARAALPGLSWKETRAWMGHRPAPSDSIPVIGELSGAPGTYLGFGHHHVGLTGGAKTGRLLASLIAGKRPNMDLAPYAPERFS